MEILFQAVTPCKKKKRLKKQRETASGGDESKKIQKTKHACIVEAYESTRKRLESTLPKRHEDHIEEKRNIERSPQFGAQSFSDATSDGNSRCESRSGQGMEEAPPAWHVDNRGARRRLFWRHKKRKRVHFAALVEICHPKIRSWNRSI